MTCMTCVMSVEVTSKTYFNRKYSTFVVTSTAKYFLLPTEAKGLTVHYVVLCNQKVCAVFTRASH
jgi:hypothetical protein